MDENPYKGPREQRATANKTAPASSQESTTRAVILTVSVGLGVLIWLGMPILVGENEAWDSSWYWPCVMAASFLLGVFQPRHPWQPVLALMSAQVVVFLVQLTIRPAALAPLGLVFMAVFSVVNLVIAYVGGGVVRISQKIWRSFVRSA